LEPHDVDRVTDASRVNVRPVDADLADELAAFLESLHAAGDEATFHPHPLTREAAWAIAHRTGRDVYLAAIKDGTIVGYGMLRGWDEGFDIPSLGVAVHPQHRGAGIARLMMGALHEIARQQGAPRIRLTVDADHTAAQRLYRSLGYLLEPLGNGRLVGSLDISHVARPPVD
jgi:ribosomal-protein-alanine N-acetyltransferase